MNQGQDFQYSQRLFDEEGTFMNGGQGLRTGQRNWQNGLGYSSVFARDDDNGGVAVNPAMIMPQSAFTHQALGRNECYDAGQMSDLDFDLGSGSSLVGNIDTIPTEDLLQEVQLDLKQNDMLHLLQAEALNVPSNRVYAVNVVQAEHQDPAGSNEYKIPMDECVVFDNWTGVYNFKVTPILDADPVTCRKSKIFYLPEREKLFCNTGTSIPFKFEMDFDNMNRDKYMIRTFLVYKDDDAVSKPVLRCTMDIEKEKNVTDKDKMDRLVHLMRFTEASSDMVYMQHPDSKRCYILVPVKEPEPGMTFVMRRFSFSCRNSCNVPNLNGKQRNTICIMFCLYDLESGKVCGRSHINIRVCSAPVRDFNKELSKESECKVKRKRKMAERQEAGLPSPKQVNLGSAEVRMAEGDMQQNPGPAISIRHVVRASLKPPTEDDGVSSSQETVVSFTEEPQRIHLRKLVGSIRWALLLKDDPNEELRAYSGHIYSALKMTENLVQAARELQKKLDNEKKNDDDDDSALP